MLSMTSRFLALSAFLVGSVLAIPAALPSLQKNGTVVLQSRATSYTTCNIPGKVVAMTFDDGPYIYNTQLVDYLGSQGVVATFFMNGDNYDCIYSEPYAGYVQNVYNSGHQIGSHTWSHPDLTTLSDADVTSQLVRNDEAFSQIIDVKPRYFRPPYGAINAAIDSLLADQNQIPVTWNFDSGDSTGSSPSESIAAYAAWIQTGQSLIALNHETYPGTVNTVVEAVIPMLLDAGYRFVTIAECLNLGSAYIAAGPKGPGNCN
ncbi:Carbohydrate esterase 4 protein [Tulasnella sp. 330]|nr:Carbohydrate esterase 4 protein [Tulasnella sp. 330]KAG8871996.1 Carbohydrate esterase 4 protein [Tulasnella sp. 331]KAG8875268.1 Carbohydrate esterase 4 protein [Tulasnella sp. 332]